VQIDLATGEIKGYQIEESGESNFPLSRGTLLLLAGSIGIVAVALVAVKLLGII
jgi:hypothetical protein